MARSKAEIRYARALFHLAEEQGVADAVSAELRSLREVIKSSTELRTFLAHPLLQAEQQEAIMRAMFETRLGELTVRFLAFLAVRRRLPQLDGICDEFETLYLEARSILRIEIVSAFDLRADQVESIGGKMAERYGQRVQATLSTDAGLLGGFLVRVRDTVHDYSVRGKLDAMHMALMHA
jgi:F-type H+-transporting ATPase subunit delta